MTLLNRKSTLQRLLETASESLDAASAIKAGLPDGLSSGKALKSGLPSGKSLKAAWSDGNVLKAGVIAGGLAGLTAGSAGISSLRRRKEGAAGDS